jgi:hypothetical protein
MLILTILFTTLMLMTHASYCQAYSAEPCDSGQILRAS